MRTFTPLVLLSICVITLSCKNAEETTRNKNAEQDPTAILADNFDAYRDNAGITINAVTLEGNILSLAVQYSGGCEKHEFKLIGSTAIQKSLPPKRGVMLFHNNNGDSCRELVEETLRFDISVLAYEGGEIILNLDGWATPVSYTRSK